MGFTIQLDLTARSSNQNLSSSPLLRLPVEIRLSIYAIVIASGSSIRDYSISTTTDSDGSTQISSERVGVEYPQNMDASFVERYFGLLLTCRQIYAEAKLLPFQLITLTGSATRFARMRWTEEQRNAIRNVRLVVSLSGRWHPVWGDSWGNSFREIESELATAVSGLTGLRKIGFKIRYTQWEWLYPMEGLRKVIELAFKILRGRINDWAEQGTRQDILECEIEALGRQREVDVHTESWVLRPLSMREKTVPGRVVST